MEEMDTEAQQEESARQGAQAEVFTWKKLLTSRELRMPLFIACMLQVIQQLSGINAV